MAALTIAAGLTLAAAGAAIADEPATTAPVVNKVTLALRITGLGQDGCEVEIKPGHPACEFPTITKKVDSRGQINLPGLEVRSTSADRDCLFAITVKEPGQPPKTLKRGLRLNVPSDRSNPVPEQTFLCLLRSPSLAARDDASRVVR